jgi:hypothetical protein
VKIAPTSWLAHDGMARAMIAKGELSAARRLIRSAIEAAQPMLTVHPSINQSINHSLRQSTSLSIDLIADGGV